MFDSKEIAQKALLRAAEIKETRKRRRYRLSVCAVLLCVCLAAVSILLVTYPSSVDSGTIDIEETDMPLAYPQTTASDNIQTDEKPVFPKIVSVTISANKTEIDLYLLNPEENICLMSFEIILSDTGETLCQTGFIEPSMYAGAQSISRGLPKGEYNARIIIRAYSPDTRSEIGTEQGEFVIVAK